jgi:hypothetical protein
MIGRSHYPRPKARYPHGRGCPTKIWDSPFRHIIWNSGDRCLFPSLCENKKLLSLGEIGYILVLYIMQNCMLCKYYY